MSLHVMATDATSQNKKIPEIPIPENNFDVSPIPEQPRAPDDFLVPSRETTRPAPEIQPPQIEQLPELPPTREQEKQLDVEEDTTLEGRIEALKQKLRKKKKKQTHVPIVKDELTIRIEKVMEDGLGDAFLALTPIQKQEFKIKGEETAWQIRQLMKKTHVKIKEIFRLIYEWLKILPGINKFFLEQEAKIKADKILSLKNYHQEDK